MLDRFARLEVPVKKPRRRQENSFERQEAGAHNQVRFVAWRARSLVGKTFLSDVMHQ